MRPKQRYPGLLESVFDLVSRLPWWVNVLCAIGSYFALREVNGPPPLRTALPQVNWTALALAVAIAALDISFLLLYRGGFDVSLGQIVTQSAAALALLLLGVTVFSEKISLVNSGGILLCVVGL